jgi:hypothetical protein
MKIAFTIIITVILAGSCGYLDWQWIKRISNMFDDRNAARAFCDARRENREEFRFVKWRDTDIKIKHPEHQRWEFLTIIEDSLLPHFEGFFLFMVVGVQIMVIGCLGSAMAFTAAL